MSPSGSISRIDYYAKGGQVDNTSSPKKEVAQCPFKPGVGYATKSGRQEYIEVWGKKEDRTTEIPLSLSAEPDPSQPLYYWQLYSLIGSKPIIEIVTDFYDSVYEDYENPWFRDVFDSIASKRHHIRTQAAYWIDAMGGGRYYLGGSGRLNFHHHHNAGEIMNKDGARRWMYHMRGALHKYKEEAMKQDERIFPTMVKFLETKMMIYAHVHDWDYDASDFDGLLDDPSTMVDQVQDNTESHTCDDDDDNDEAKTVTDSDSLEV